MATAEHEETTSGSGRVGAVTAMRSAARQLAQLTGCEAIFVSALTPRDGGWSAEVEVVEVARIPETTSVMATYRVMLDEQGELLEYERLQRYVRGRTDR